MKRNSVATVAVVAILLLSMAGAGAAAPAASVVENSTETDVDDVSQSNDVTQSDETSITTVTTEVDESSNVTIDDTVEADVDVGSDGGVVDSVFSSIDAGTDDDSGTDVDLGVGSLLESLFDDLGISDGVGDGDDGDSETDGDETDGTDDENGTDETDSDEGETDDADGDDESGTSDDPTEGEEDETGDNETDSDGDETSDDEAESGDLDRAAVERYVHEAINEERTARGLEPLAFDTELRDIARAHSQDRAERGYFAHVDPDGNDVVDRYEAAGYDCSVNGYTGGENIAQTWYDTPVVTDDGETVQYETEEELAEGIVTQWMNSPGHRENILATQWENEGIGIYVTDDDRVFATQNFC